MFAVVNEINSFVAFATFGGADNIDGFIQRNQHEIVRFTWLHQSAIDLNHIARLNLIANSGALAALIKLECVYV